jgi:hypothetical protein
MAQAATGHSQTPEHVRRIRERYLAEARGDAPYLSVEAMTVALDRAISDALADLCEVERRSLQRERLISRGYIRQGPARQVGSS